MAQLREDGSKQITLTRTQFERIQTAFSSFYKKTKCGAIVLSDVSGLAVAKVGRLDTMKLELLSTLTAGNYAATAEIARLIGEDTGFKVQFHEGQGQNIYVSGVNEDFLMTIVFSKQTTFGMIRVLAAKTISELEEILALPMSSENEEQITIVSETLVDTSFKDELSSRLDSILFSK